MAQGAVTAPPTPENRQRAIQIIAAQFIQGGADPQEAADSATLIIDAAIQMREEAGEAGSDTEPD